MSHAPPPPDTEELVRRAGDGDASARLDLLTRHRRRLTRMVEVRLDRRLSPRLDPSDVVQEALADAARGLDAYLRERPLPFYPWLRQFAWDRVVGEYERHIVAGKRSVTREQRPPLPGGSEMQLVDRLVAGGSSACGRASREERRALVRSALAGLESRDREVLELRYLEGLSNAEAAAVLGVSEGAVKMRHLRALERLRDRLEAGPMGDDR